MYRRIQLDFNKPVIWRKEKVSFFCKECGIEKFDYQSKIDAGRKYCSTKCKFTPKLDTTKKKVPYLCKWCGDEKYAYQYDLDIGRKYCSVECAKTREHDNYYARLIKR